MKVTELYYYPIKSCGGISLEFATVNPKGLNMDRRWMLIDKNNNKLSQREIEKMSQVFVTFAINGFMIYSKSQEEIFLSDNHMTFKNSIKVKIWDDICEAQLMPEKYHNWFSKELGVPCRLVYILDNTQRPTRKSDVGFADGYHSLIISQESVNYLNFQLGYDGVTVKNFRPNIVFSGGEKIHIEDEWTGKKVKIGNVTFSADKICSRCKVPTIDPKTSLVNPEINKVLASYRFKKEPEKGIYFGMNLSTDNPGETIRVGDEITLI